MRVLFLSHDLGASGAPRVLLHLTEWLREQTDTRVAFLARRGGSLYGEFAAIGPTHVLSAGRLAYLGRRDPRIARLALRRKVMALTRHLDGVDLVYSNTLTNGAVLRDLSFLGVPVLSHAHELTHWLRHRVEAEDLRQTLAASSAYIACSRASADALIDDLGIGTDRVHLVHEFIAARTLAAEVPTANDVLRNELGIGSDSFVVGASGPTDFRKGVDLFVDVARTVSRSTALDIQFVWVGGEGSDLEYMRRDARQLGLDDRLHFVGLRNDAPGYFRGLDAFLLPSREDPFPLVVLENAALAKPIICFASGGGAPEFVELDAGFVVPYLDVEAMAYATIQLASEPKLVRKLGLRAQQKAVERHDVRDSCPVVFDIMRDVTAAEFRPRRGNA